MYLCVGVGRKRDDFVLKCEKSTKESKFSAINQYLFSISHMMVAKNNDIEHNICNAQKVE